MEKRVFFCLVIWICLTMTLALVPEAKAEYPEKLIEIFNHSSPGGGSDLICRTVAHILAEEGLVKQKIQVVNRTGGGGAVAMNYLASKKGNPYLIMHGTTSLLMGILRGTHRMKFEDITPIAMLAEDPVVVFALYDSPYKDMKTVIAEAKKAPGKVSGAIGTVGASSHISAHRIQKAAGVEFNIVVFKGGAGAATALLGGHVDLNFGSISDFGGQIEAKKVRPLAVMSEKRLPFYPDVPTMKEVGLDTTMIQFRGFWGPQDFPPYALKFWGETFAKIVKTQGWKKYLKQTECVDIFLKHEEFRRYLVKYFNDLRQDISELEVYKKKK